MEFLSLRTFQAVVEEGGILSASRKLNTVQSNVTTRIKRLEEELGAELFYRRGRGLELAPSGKVLLDYARQLLHLESLATTAVRQVGIQTGEIRIGAMETFAALRLPEALKGLRQVHAGLELHIETNTSGYLIERILEHKLDCAFVGGVVDHPDISSYEVLQEELVVIRSKQAPKGQLPLILFREGCAYRARALTWQRECGYQTNEIMELGSLDAILGCVAVGLGCTLVPSWVVSQSRHRHEFIIEPVATHLAAVPTLMIRHTQAIPLKALDTLARVVTTQDLMNEVWE